MGTKQQTRPGEGSGWGEDRGGAQLPSCGISPGPLLSRAPLGPRALGRNRMRDKDKKRGMWGCVSSQTCALRGPETGSQPR